jgi:2',3'-cyclic-nucleotide 2'-phosphodiesterase (5'-nucleotidase family)
MQENEVSEGHFQLYSYPEKLPSPPIDKEIQQRIVFASINDLNGQLDPKVEGGVNIGGQALLKSYLSILKNHYPNELITVDAGNFTNINKDPEDVIEFYNDISIDVAGLGFNEFNLNYRKLKNPYLLTTNLRKAKFKTLSANLYDLQLSKKLKWKYIDNTHILSLNSIKIGFTSVISQATALDFTDKMNGFYAKDIAQTIISEASWLRKKGADIVVVLANTKGNCNLNKNLPKGKFNFDPNNDESCDKSSEIFNAYKLIPKDLVDVVFLSGSDSKIANRIYDIPTVQSMTGTEYLSITEFILNKNSRKVENVFLHQPVKLCEKFLTKSQDCYFENEDLTKLSPAVFLNTNVIHSTEPH